MTHVRPQLVSLAGRKGLVTGIANDQSIAWGCAKAFRFLGADLAVTYLNDKAKPHVEPLARELEAEIAGCRSTCARTASSRPCSTQIGQRLGPARLPAALDRLRAARRPARAAWSTAPRTGFLQAMDISCWSFIRMAKLAEPLMDDGGALFTHDLSTARRWWSSTTT